LDHSISFFATKVEKNNNIINKNRRK